MIFWKAKFQFTQGRSPIASNALQLGEVRDFNPLNHKRSTNF
jgi:hypothetical protein